MSKERFTDNYIFLSLVNLLLVGLSGLALRAFPFTDFGGMNYNNFMHGHSHFAFGGWVLPVLFGLLLKYFPDLRKTVSFTHIRVISFALMGSAYGMLLTFPFQGYATVSIIFSSLSILATFYMAIIFWQAVRGQRSLPVKFLRAGLIYLIISSIGPFATAPLIAMGLKASPMYFNAIYFYLHFQYNGWFLFCIMAIFLKIFDTGDSRNRNEAFWMINLGCILTYFLSTLWNGPHLIFYMLGAAGAIVQIPGFYKLLRNARISCESTPQTLFKAAMLVLALKLLLQLFSAFPQVAEFAYLHRNIVIAYLHMVLLGFVSMFVFGAITNMMQLRSGIVNIGLVFFVIGFVASEIILVTGTFFFAGYMFTMLMLFASVVMVSGILLFVIGVALLSHRSKESVHLEQLVRPYGTT